MLISVLLVFAAVVIPQYASYRQMAADIAARSSIRHAMTAIESYANNSGRAYAGADVGALRREGIRIGANQWLLVASLGDAYWILAQSEGSSGLWVRSSEDAQDRLIAAN